MSLKFAAELHEKFGTDPHLEQKGIILNLGGGLKFTLARAGGANKRFNAAIERKTRPYRRQIQSGAIDVDLMNDIMCEALAETVILDWEGVYEDGYDEDGNPTKVAVPFTVENCIEFLKTFPDVASAIQQEATNAANYRALDVEFDVKN